MATIFPFSPLHEAALHDFLPLEDVTVIVFEFKLPNESSRWPVKFINVDSVTELAATVTTTPYIICGTTPAVRKALSEMKARDFRLPLYLIVDVEFDVNDSEVITGLRHFVAPNMRHGHWEEVNAVVCSIHVATVPEMILKHARSEPSRVALRGHNGWGRGWHGVKAPGSEEIHELTYEELCIKAWTLGHALENRFGVCFREMTSPMSPPNQVGFILPPSSRSAVCLLALGLRRLGAVVIAASPPSLRAYQLSRAPCLVVLALSDAFEGDNSNHDGNEVGMAVEPSDGGFVNDVRVVFIDILWEELFAMKSTSPLPRNCLASVVVPRGFGPLNEVCLVEWTSGSTGRPKAMAVTQVACSSTTM
jgi:hypothetical protein